MKTRQILLASAIALALSACGNSSAPADTAAPAADAAAPVAEAPATPVAEAAPAEAAPVAATAPAVVENCATTIEANDMMKYNADSITVPASCTQFTVNLKHVGKMAANVMGHNFVVAKEADMAGIDADGAGVQPDHVKADDARVVAHTKVIGGGESTSVSFDVAKIKDGGPYKFFCSFPGHMALMQGSIQVQ